MSVEIKNTRLQEFCRQAAAHVDELQEALNVRTLPLPEDILNQLSMLRGRLKRPDVRILILGPLKSGKSTLMTVLTKNPRVSQINQLPAYPCVVEVQDIDREGGATPQETSTFYKNGTSEETISLAEGMKKLDDLLRDYIRDENATMKYDRVVQRVDLALSHGDLNLVLIDSPGLMFGKQGYSEETQHLLTDSDVAIFVVRPEQLFFQSIKDHIKIFVKDAVVTAGCLSWLNASTQARNL